MKFLKNIELQTKVSIYSASLIFLLFTILSFVVFKLQHQRIEESTYSTINYQIDAIENSINTLNEHKNTQLKNSSKLSAYILQESSVIKESQEKINILAKNELTKENLFLELKVWRNQGMRLQTNTEMVDRMKSFTGVDIGVFQQTKEGYVLISTTILNRRNERANGIFYPNSATICKIIEKGEKYDGRISFDGKPYMVSARPYFIKGRISGFITVATPVFIENEIKQIISNLNLIPGSNINLINDNDELIYSSNELKLSFPVSLSKLDISRNSISTLKNIEDDFENNYLYIKYLKSINNYLVIEIPENVVFKNLNDFKILLYFSMFISALLLIIGMNIFFKAFSTNFKVIISVLDDISVGKPISPYKKYFSKEFLKIFNYILILDKSNTERINFINELKNNHLTTDFKLLSNEDQIGKALLELRRELVKTSESINTTKQQDEQAKWFNAGRSKISDILREYSSNIIGLGDELIKEIVHFLDIPVGGIFIISEDRNQKKYLDMLSAFAYDRKKFIEKKIPYGDGLIGACAAEQYTMNIKGVPADYVHIESGLGGKAPQYLLLVPIVADNITLGVIELAAFQEFSEQKIKYIESISEAIASTITITRLNTKTSILLEESKENIELLKNERDSLSQELHLLKEKFDKLKRDLTDSEFQYKTQIVKKQMTIDNLNRRIETLETN